MALLNRSTDHHHIQPFHITDTSVVEGAQKMADYYKDAIRYYPQGSSQHVHFTRESHHWQNYARNLSIFAGSQAKQDHNHGQA